MNVFEINLNDRIKITIWLLQWPDANNQIEGRQNIYAIDIYTLLLENTTNFYLIKNKNLAEKKRSIYCVRQSNVYVTDC